MFASRQIRYRFDFAAARRAITSAGLGSGKNGYFRVALIWARVGVRKDSEPRMHKLYSALVTPVSDRHHSCVRLDGEARFGLAFRACTQREWERNSILGWTGLGQLVKHPHYTH